MIGRAEVSGYIVLLIGVILLVFTFINAYLFLVGVLDLSIVDWVAELGELLGPLVETCIRIMYLGIMGWIGALLTKRGIEFLTKLPREGNKEAKKEVKKEVDKGAKKESKKKAAVQGKKG